MYQNNILQGKTNWQPANGVQANSLSHHAHNKHNGFNAQQQNQGWQQPNQNQSLQQTLVSLLSQLVGLLQAQQSPMQGGMNNGFAQQATNMDALLEQQKHSTASYDYQNQSANMNAFYQQEVQNMNNPLIELQPSVLPPEMQAAAMGSTGVAGPMGAQVIQATNMDGLLAQQMTQMVSSLNAQKAGKEIDRLFPDKGQPNLDLNDVTNKIKEGGMYALLQLKVEDGIRSPYFQQQSPQVQAQLVTEANNIFAKYGVEKPEPRMMQSDIFPQGMPMNMPNVRRLEMMASMEAQSQRAETNMTNQMVNAYYEGHGLGRPMALIPDPMMQAMPMQGFTNPQSQMQNNMNSFPAQQPAFELTGVVMPIQSFVENNPHMKNTIDNMLEQHGPFVTTDFVTKYG